MTPEQTLFVHLDRVRQLLDRLCFVDDRAREAELLEELRHASATVRRARLVVAARRGTTSWLKVSAPGSGGSTGIRH